MEAILSIKPIYVEKIKSKTKLFEFRKLIPKKKVSKVFIYSSKPVKKIVGYFTYSKVINDKPSILWERCKDFAGIDEITFFEYFKNHLYGFAIKIENLVIFDIPIEPKEFIPNFYPPQSFMYTKEEQLTNLMI